MHIGWPQLFVAVVAFAGSVGASALGFGSIRSSVVLGQPLNLAVPVSLAEGESLAADCASAEVISGDTKLPPGSVRVRVTQGRDASESVLRITTTSVVDEPVLSVTVNAGCPTRLSRTLVLLADPPLVSTAAAATEAPVLPAVAAPARSPATATAQPSAARATEPRRATRPAAPSRATRTAVSEAARPAVAAAVPATLPASAPASGAARATVAAASRPLARAEGRARLQLDSGQVSIATPALLAAQEQASAARATAASAEAAASAATERLRTVEADLVRVRQDAKAQTDALLQLRQQLALDRADRGQPSALTYALAGLAALLLALVAWLALRLRQQARVEQSRPDWWDRSHASELPSEMNAAASEAQPSRRQGLPSVPQRLPSAPAAWPDADDSRNGEVDVLISPPTLPAPTAVTIPPLPPVTPREEEAARAMSVDEQIDLEQQADFFIALGHDDAAIDLLMAHMRSTGGASPLPFLKLLEIHRRRNQREAYERTRVRFNQRFNSIAPEWQADPKSGRKLEEYQLAIGRIQRAWPAPLDAMAELEALLFRRGSGAELFDLPAYQEVLFLYQMARDLHQAEDSGATADVDVLLPIGGRSLPMVVPEGTIVLRPEFNDGEPVALSLDDAPDLGVDLDLSTRPGDDAALAQPIAPAAPPSLSLEHIDDASPPGPEEDFWGNNPDARPTR